MAYYGWYEIRVLRGGNVSDPVIDAASTIQRWTAEGLDRIGVPLVAAALGLLLMAAVSIHRHKTRQEASGTDEEPGPPGHERRT